MKASSEMDRTAPLAGEGAAGEIAPPVSLPLFVLVSALVLIGAVIQGAVGFGLGVFAVPFLQLIEYASSALGTPW